MTPNPLAPPLPQTPAPGNASGGPKLDSVTGPGQTPDAGKQRFEEALAKLVTALPRGDNVRIAQVSAFGGTYEVPIRDTGTRPTAEAPVREALAYAGSYTIRAELSTSLTFSNLGVRWQFARHERGVIGELCVVHAGPKSPPLVTRAAVFGKIFTDKRAEIIDGATGARSTELTLAEAAREVAVTTDYRTRPDPLIIDVDGKEIVVRPPRGAVTAADITLRDMLHAAKAVSIIATLPPDGSFSHYGFTWPTTELIGGRACRLSWKGEGTERQPASIEVFDSRSPAPSAKDRLHAAKPPLRALIGTSTGWTGTDFTPADAVDAMRTVRAYEKRGMVASLLTPGAPLIVRIAGKGEKEFVEDRAFELALKSMGTFTIRLGPSACSLREVFGLRVPKLPLTNLPVDLRYKSHSNGAPSCRAMTMYDPSGLRVMMAVDREARTAKTDLNFSQFLKLTTTHGTPDSGVSRGEIVLGGQTYPIRWDTRPNSWANAVVAELKEWEPEVEFRIPKASKGLGTALGLGAEFEASIPDGAVVVARFKYGSRVTGG